MSKIEVQISASRPIFIEADADAFGQVFAEMSSREQVAVFRAMVKHMRPHRLQWDYIAIELEQDENREVRDELLQVLSPSNSDVSGEMLEACHKVVNNWGELHHKDLMQLRAAIAKAEGRS